jgi:S1-C subfamily serine protease
MLLLVVACVARGSQDGGMPVPVDDSEIKVLLLKEAERLMDAGKSIEAKDLMAGARPTATVQLLPPATEPLSPAQSYQRAKPAVLVIGGLYKCGKCSKWHCSAASGFLISSSGAAVTAYHVMAAEGRKTFVAMTSDGTVHPVTAVLAASEADDVAIIQLDGRNLPALPLRVDAPVGTRVIAVHHPDEQFYTLTEGILSRYDFGQRKDHRKVPEMVITAEFARGSSGAPIFDDRGNAIGLVCSTRTIYYSEERKDPQMVLRDCAPSASVLKLIASPGAPCPATTGPAGTDRRPST